MTVVFFSRLFYPHIGGVEKHVLEISKILVKKGHKIIVFTEHFDKRLKLKENIQGIVVYRVPVGEESFLKKFIIWKQLWKYRSLIEKADIIHCHDIFFWYFPFRFLFPKKPVYTTFHGYETKFPLSRKAVFIRKISEELSWGNICVGDYIKKWYRTKPAHTTYGGVEIPLINTNARTKYQLKNRELRIVFIGRLEKDTGIELYLKTLDILKRNKLRFEITFLGKGRYGKQASEYGIVKHKRSNDTNHYNDTLKNANVVFASSYLSILEAIKYKKLVFAIYDNPLKEDYLKLSPFAKWIIIKNSPQEIVYKIVYYLNHQKEKEKITTTAYKWVKDQTWERVLGVYMALWGYKIPDRQENSDTGSE